MHAIGASANGSAGADSAPGSPAANGHNLVSEFRAKPLTGCMCVWLCYNCGWVCVVLCVMLIESLSSADAAPNRSDGFYWRHFTALFTKRFQNAKRDRRVLTWTCLYPVLVCSVGIGALTAGANTQPSIVLSTQSLNVVNRVPVEAGAGELVLNSKCYWLACAVMFSLGLTSACSSVQPSTILRSRPSSLLQPTPPLQCLSTFCPLCAPPKKVDTAHSAMRRATPLWVCTQTRPSSSTTPLSTMVPIVPLPLRLIVCTLLISLCSVHRNSHSRLLQPSEHRRSASPDQHPYRFDHSALAPDAHHRRSGQSDQLFGVGGVCTRFCVHHCLFLGVRRQRGGRQSQAPAAHLWCAERGVLGQLLCVGYGELHAAGSALLCVFGHFQHRSDARRKCGCHVFGTAFAWYV
jgi:hypothetical protein